MSDTFKVRTDADCRNLLTACKGVVFDSGYGVGKIDKLEITFKVLKSASAYYRNRCTAQGFRNEKVNSTLVLAGVFINNSFTVFVYVILVNILGKNFGRFNILFENNLLYCVRKCYLADIVKKFFKHVINISAEAVVNHNGIG